MLLLLLCISFINTEIIKLPLIRRNLPSEDLVSSLLVDKLIMTSSISYAIPIFFFFFNIYMPTNPVDIYVS